MKKLEEKLEGLKVTEDVIREALSENRKEQNEIRVTLFKEKTGLNVGDRVELKSGESGEITGFMANYSSVNPIMCFYKKDGSLGKRESVLYDWDIRDAVIEKSGEIE